MHDRSATGTSMEKPENDFHSHSDGEHHFGGDPRLNHHGHQAPYDWMFGGGRGGRRAMMMAMMDPSGISYGMEHGHFGFGGRGGRGGRGGWFGFGGRGRHGHGHGHGGRGRGRHGRMYFVDDDDEPVTSMADQMDECHLSEGCRHVSGSSESSSSSSSSESDDEQNAPGDDVQGKHPHDGEVEGQSKDSAQRETMKSNATEHEKDHPSSSHACNHGNRRRGHGRSHHKHRSGKHKHNHYPAFHHSMIPPPPPPHLYGFFRPPFPPMHHPHHGYPDFHGNRHMAKKYFKQSIKQWYKAQKWAWKRQQGSHCCRHRVQRSDEDETTTGCESDDDFVNLESQLPPWLFFPYDHHGCRHGRRGKKEKKHGKRRRQCNCERPRPTEDITAKTTAKDQVDDVDQVEKVHEVHDESDDQAPMEANAE